MSTARATIGIVAILAGLAIGVKHCAGGPQPSTTSASASASASTSASTSSSSSAREAAKLTTRAVDQAPTTVRDHLETKFYRPDGRLDHVTTRDREVHRGRRREAEAVQEAEASTSTASTASSSSSTSSTRSSSSTWSTPAPATWAILWGGELVPARRPVGVVAGELRLLGPIWASAWATPELEAGAGLRLQLGRVTLGFAPRILPAPALLGLTSATLRLVGPLELAAWALPWSSAGAGVRVAW